MDSCRKYGCRCIVFLALMALSLRSLIPIGYMPDFSGDGKGLLPLVICDGYEDVAQDLDDPCPMHAHHNPHHGGLCPFGAANLLSYSLPDVAVATSVTYISLLSLPFAAEVVTRQAVFTLFSPRAPPFFS